MAGLRRTRRPLVALVILLLILVIGYAIRAYRSDDSGSTGSAATARNAASAERSATTSTSRSGVVSSAQPSATVALARLPVQARRTVALIQAGGPFPYPRDGVVFSNFEHHLPSRASGYYHEYTVVTPGESDRGARRIIAGRSGEFYYTADHYDSFVRVDVTR